MRKSTIAAEIRNRNVYGRTALMCCLATVCSWRLDAYAQPSGQPDVELEVRIDPQMVDASDLQHWVDKESRNVLATLPDRERGGLLRVEIAGSIYDYEITMTAIREGRSIGEPEVWKCECSNEDLLERLRAALPVTAERLTMTTPAVPSRRVSRPVLPPDNNRHEEDLSGRQPLGRIGSVGVALMATGFAGAVGGVVLVALGVDRQRGDRPGGDIEVRNYQSPGIAMVAGGAGLALTGLVSVLLRGRSGVRRIEISSVAPRVEATARVGLAVSGRF